MVRHLILNTHNTLGVEALTIGKAGNLHLLKLYPHYLVLLLEPLNLTNVASDLLELSIFLLQM